MKRLLLLLLLAATPLLAATSTLTGTFVDASGNPVNGYLILTLPVPAVDTATGNSIAVTPVRYRVVNGIVQSGPPVYDVAGLQPQNLYYITSLYDNSGTRIFTANYFITGTPFNLSAAIPTNVTTSNISFAPGNLISLAGNNTFTGNNIFTGTLNCKSFENIACVDTVNSQGWAVPILQSALNSLSTGGTVLVAPGTYTGPTTIPSNVKMLCLAPPLSNTVAQTFAITTNNVVDQCKLTYTAQLTLSSVQNSTIEGFIFDFNRTGFGVSLTSTNFTHWNYNTFRECGSAAAPRCLQLLGAGTLGTSYNTFDHNFINPNGGTSQFGICVYLAGIGAVNAGTPATENKFYDTTCTGNVLYAIESELNTDTNYFQIFNVFQVTTPPANAAVLAFNLNTPASEQDADGSLYNYINYTGAAEPLIRTGVSKGNQITYTAAGINAFPGTTFISDQTGSQNWNFELH